MVGIVGTDEIASLDEIAYAHVFRVVAQKDIVAQGSSDLTRLVVAAQACASRDTHHAIDSDAFFEQDIGNTRREESSHASSLKNNSSFQNSIMFSLYKTVQI